MDNLQLLKTALYEKQIELMELLHYAGFSNIQFDQSINIAPDCIYKLKKQFVLLQKLIPQLEGILLNIKSINIKINRYEN